MEDRAFEKIYINLIAYPLFTLGPLKRVGIWFQGCSIGCKGCISKHTWIKEQKYKRELKEVVKEIKEFECKNITISGGEPFDQPEALFLLLKEIREEFEDILVYSGYRYEELSKKFPFIIELIDVLIDGEFIKEKPSNKLYRGSTNQRMFVFNQKLISRYKEFFKIIKSKESFQLYFYQDRLYSLGIP